LAAFDDDVGTTPGEFLRVLGAVPGPLELRFRLLVVVIGEERLFAPPVPLLGAMATGPAALPLLLLLLVCTESKLAARERLPVELGARDIRSCTGASSGESAVRDSPRPWLRDELDPLISLRE